MSRVLSDSLTHAYAECEKPNCPMSAIDVPRMTISFQNKIFLFYKSRSLGDFQYQLAFPKLCVFMHLCATDFRVYTARFHTPFQHFYDLSLPMIMSNRECRIFHHGGGGIYPNLLCPTHIFFIFKIVRLILDVVP